MAVPVFHTGEIDRILAIPRRPAQWSDEENNDAVELLSEHLRAPGGTKKLRVVQARALLEAMDHHRLVCLYGAGAGKFLIGALLPRVLKAKRTLLLTPAHLREQTIDEWEKWSKEFNLPPLGEDVRLLSYQSLSTARFASFLEEFQPDLIIADEAHFLARLSSSRSRRIFRYIKIYQPMFVPMSASMLRKSLKECAHLMEAALGEACPVPMDWTDLQQWCMATDDGIKEDARMAPGALLSFCNDEERAAGLDGVRRAIQRRIIETPGIVATTEQSVDSTLILKVREVEVPEIVRECMETLHTEYRLPNGDTFDSPLSHWMHARELGCGFTYRWDPPGPPEWMDARKAWFEFVRNAMEHPPREQCPSCRGAKCKACEHRGWRPMPLDSPFVVWNAVRQGRFGKVEEFDAWNEIKDTFKPNPVPLWVDDYLFRDAEEWALETGGIVWVAHSSAVYRDGSSIDGVDDAQLGAAFSRIPFFGAGKAGEGIRDYRGPCAASIRSHGTGKNLTQWNRGLIMCMPSSGSQLEQLLARLHRPGQPEDEVTFEWYCHTKEMYGAFCSARSEARFQEAISGNLQRSINAISLMADGHSFSDDFYEKKRDTDDPLWSSAK